MKKILFVCTGNIFRSLTAEYALRAVLPDDGRIAVSSAGTRHSPTAKVRDDVAAYLETKSLDVSAHQRRTVTKELLAEAHVVVSMSHDHQSFLLAEHEMPSLLFTEACGEPAKPLLDIDDLFPLEQRHSPAAQRHVYKIIDQIVALSPNLARRLVDG